MILDELVSLLDSMRIPVETASFAGKAPDQYVVLTPMEDVFEIFADNTPQKLAKAISAELSVEIAEAILYADDAAAESIKSFKNGKLTLGVDDIGVDKAQLLTGAGVDDNGVFVSTSKDLPPYVAIGFRAQKSNGKYRYFWLYKVQFGIPSVSLQTKGDSISFQTPSIEGTIVRRNKAAGNDKHPWKAEVTEGDAGVSDATINGWFNAVYEPAYAGD